MATWNCLAVVGSGTMGSGIAYEIARNLHARVIVCEVPEALDRARSNLERLIERPLQKGQITREQADEWSSRLSFTSDFASLSQADAVIEAAFEDLNLKRDIFARLDTLCAPTALLATNTSGLSITRIAAATNHPERVIGLHFFNPVPAMKLVEIVRAYQTSDETVARARELCQDLKKETVLAKDYPGFITTRIGMLMLAEAIRCLEEGVGTVEDIDLAMKLAFNHPMGPLALADLVGLDVLLHILDDNRAELGERFLASPLLRQMVAAGHLGQKTGRGFYDYARR
jgi:3-hydroxybutyryl-CoA dehydrogenase